MKQQLGALVLELDHSPSYSVPQKAEPSGLYQWAFLPSGFPVGFSQ